MGDWSPWFMANKWTWGYPWLDDHRESMIMINRLGWVVPSTQGSWNNWSWWFTWSRRNIRSGYVDCTEGSWLLWLSRLTFSSSWLVRSSQQPVWHVSKKSPCRSECGKNMQRCQMKGSWPPKTYQSGVCLLFMRKLVYIYRRFSTLLAEHITLAD